MGQFQARKHHKSSTMTHLELPDALGEAVDLVGNLLGRRLASGVVELGQGRVREGG